MELDELKRRIAATADPTRLARLNLEAALLAEGEPARAFLEAAQRHNPELVAAIHLARRAEPDVAARLPLIDRELRAAGTESERTELLIERARALAAAGESAAAVVEAWQRVRAVAPDHDEMLAALEVALIRAGDERELSAHYARLARATAKDPLLACSYLIARGRIYERLGDDAAAEAAYLEASLLHDRARAPLARVYLRRGSYEKRRELLIEDAERTTDRALRVRMLYRAARLSDERLDDPARAIELLRRAASEAGAERSTDARVIEELVRLLEEHGDAHEAAAARRLRIGFEELPAMRALEERRLAVELEAANDPSAAIAALERARTVEPLDELSLATLDRLLATMGRDEDRLGLWIAEATRAPDGFRAARAYVRAATIADATLGRGEDALRMLRAAWASHPGDEDALDGQLRLLASPRVAPEATVSAIDLLEHASNLSQDVALRVAHLEKAASLAEEIDPARAAQLYERVLALSPTRRFAVVALQRALHRSGDHAALGALLEREAEQTSDVEHATNLRLRAATVYRRDAKDFERAVALLRRVLDQRPDHEGALLALLACYEETGRLIDARELLERLLPLRPTEQVPLRLAMAELSRRLGDLDAAIEVWRAIGEHPIATRDLARALRRRGRWAEAAEMTADDVIAGEIFEGRVSDDARAVARFRASMSDPLGRDGLLRIATRTNDHATVAELHARDEGELAELLLRTGDDAARAATLLGAFADDVDRARLLLEACLRAGDAAGAYDALALLAKSSDPHARRRARLERLRARNDLEDARALIAITAHDRPALSALADAGDHSALVALIGLEPEPSRRFVDHLLAARLTPEPLPHFLAALDLDPQSPTAIVGVLAAARGDRAAALRGERAAAEIALDPRSRIQHLLAAASLAREISPDDATDLIDAALGVDPESLEAATAATQHLIGRDPKRLLDVLQRAAFAASSPERIVGLAREAAALADALEARDRAVALLGRARTIDPRNVAVLVELGEALIKAEAWSESERALDDAINSGSESTHFELMLRAHRAMANLAEGPAYDPLRAIVALRAIVRLDPGDAIARRRLAAILGRQGQPIESDGILLKIAENAATPMEERLTTLDQLCELRLSHKDRVGAELALRERVKLDPALGGESWRKLEAFHAQHVRGDESLADTLNELVVDASADPSWLLELAELELRLGRERAAILHLRMAMKIVPDDVRPPIALAGALLAIAEHEEASKVLHGLVMRDPTKPEVLAAQERALLGSSAHEEAMVVSELRAWLGQGDESGRYRARTSHPTPPAEGVLDDAAITKWILPRNAPKGAPAVLRVVGRVIGKVVAPPTLAALGLSARERITAKSGHPLRALVDRLSAALSIERVEVYVKTANDGPVVVEPLDPPVVIVPSYLLSLADLEVVFAVARALARFVLGAHVIDKLGARGAATAVAIAIAPHGGTLPVIDGQDLEKRLTKAIDRTLKKTLEPLAKQVKPFEPDALARAVELAAIRLGYLLNGDLGSALTHVRRHERIHVSEVGKETTSTGDLMRYALTQESIELRRRLGIVWSTAPAARASTPSP